MEAGEGVEPTPVEIVHQRRREDQYTILSRGRQALCYDFVTVYIQRVYA
jgi:hypothetical protein